MNRPNMRRALNAPAPGWPIHSYCFVENKIDSYCGVFTTTTHTAEAHGKLCVDLRLPFVISAFTLVCSLTRKLNVVKVLSSPR